MCEELEESVATHGVAFTLKYTEDGPVLDRAIDVSDIMNMGWKGLLAAEKLTGIRNDELRARATALSAMELRSRFDGAVRGPYLLKFDSPITPDELQKFLTACKPDRLKEILSGAAL